MVFFLPANMSRFLLAIPDQRDVPQSEELDHQEDQDIPTEVHRPNQGRAVYRIDPRMDGMELRLDPRPISRTDRTGSSLSRTTRQSQTDGQARSNLGRAEQGTGRDFSLLARLERTDRIDELIDPFDQRLGTLMVEDGSGDGQDGTDGPARDRPALGRGSTSRRGRAVYRIDPRMDGMELRLDPRPISRTDRTGSSLSRTTRQSQTDGQARSNLGRAEQGTGRDFSLLARLERTDRIDELIDPFDQFMHFDHPNPSKAQILHLSEDLGRLWSKMVQETDKTEQTDRPATVLLLAAVQPAKGSL
ncbi:hypothetical protein IGI04_002956 [Brassica rapa subsp. trilocularis]|uniref:DUF3741 domain-containing protein n=1 Tax=Brassica rapa subsp. trilocularis TaxID=1813537 RepID=A0ABQ7NX20_BRACM|nr:hypothetical protein IGI04_002956 [Brassica rapa subsp. trilocularis]